MHDSLKGKDEKAGLPHSGDGQGNEMRREDEDRDKGKERYDLLPTIEVFVQGGGVADVQLLKLPGEARIADVLTAMRAKGMPSEAGIVLLEDEDDELSPDARLHDLAKGRERRLHLHCHRCRHIQVSVAYNTTETRAFAPSATVERVKKWADKTFELKGQDATDFVLQLTGTGTRPNEDVHIGTLVKSPGCELQFTLARKKLVQG